jgi:hypothetical protein
MSYHAFFSLSEGLSQSIMAPKGTKEEIDSHVQWVERILNIKREKYLDNPEHWASNNYDGIKNGVLCKVAIEHNDWVRRIYGKFEEWSKNPITENFEEITPKEAELFFPALEMIIVPPSRWTGEYYTDRMNCLYEAMRGRECEGISFDAKKLTEKQASAVIRLFSEFLDTDDRQLEVPKGRDYLASSYDGGYEWCESCGAITFEDSLNCSKNKCPLRKEREDSQD